MLAVAAVMLTACSRKSDDGVAPLDPTTASNALVTGNALGIGLSTTTTPPTVLAGSLPAASANEPTPVVSIGKTDNSYAPGSSAIIRFTFADAAAAARYLATVTTGEWPLPGSSTATGTASNARALVKVEGANDYIVGQVNVVGNVIELPIRFPANFPTGTLSLQISVVRRSTRTETPTPATGNPAVFYDRIVAPVTIPFTISGSAVIGTETGRPVVEVTGTLSGTVNWVATNVYVLKGFVKVADGATLNIAAGTIIRGDFNTNGTLIVLRGGTLNATGTASSPVVFTSGRPKGQRAPGDWGGIVICGRAQNNRDNDAAGTGTAIEGIPVAEGVVHGGTNNADNSGILRYVRIEYSGVPLSPDNETNGLTLGSVGSGTTIEYVQVTASGDDSFEWFGGSVNCRYLVASSAVDDDFDADFGYSGSVMFGVALRDPNRADISQSNGFEVDNYNPGVGAVTTIPYAAADLPLTNATFSNITVIGPVRSTGTPDSRYGRAAHLRRNNALRLHNSIIGAYPGATGRGVMSIDGAQTVQNANLADGDANAATTQLRVRNTTLAVPNGAGVLSFFSDQASFNNTNWFGTAAFNNTILTAATGNSDIHTILGFANTNVFNLTTPDFTPVAAASLGSVNFTGLPTFITNLSAGVTGRGAFGASATPTAWLSGWTNFDPQQATY